MSKKMQIPEMQRRKVLAELIENGDLELPVRCDECGKVLIAADIMRNRNRKIEYFMLRDDVWIAISPDPEGWGNLCIPCVERKLGRQLDSADFLND